MIGILGAMSVEIQGLMASLEQAKEQTVGRMRFVSGVLHDRDVVLAECGIGKVNAAVSAVCKYLGKRYKHILLFAEILNELNFFVCIGHKAVYRNNDGDTVFFHIFNMLS